MRTTALLLIAISLANVAFAGFIPNEQRTALIQEALSKFWGRAINSRGELIQPATEKERNIVPVKDSVAHRALDAGELSGLAEWCGLDWESHYRSLTRSARSKAMNDTQVAFVSFLHGAAQGIIVDAMKGSTCGKEEKSRIMRRLNESRERGLAGT